MRQIKVRLDKKNDKGQAAVELALLLPVIVLFLLLLIQVGFVVEHQILVVHAAREAARQGAVDASAKDIEQVARSRVALDSSHLHITVQRDNKVGGQVHATVNYNDPTNVAMIGKLLPDIDLSATVSMRVEQ